MSNHMHNAVTIKDDKFGIVKVCKICKARMSFSKDKTGRIDNRKYLEFNKANFVQPFGRTGNLYRRLYGNPDPKKFEYKPRHIARAEAEKGWKELDIVTKNTKRTSV